LNVKVDVPCPPGARLTEVGLSEMFCPFGEELVAARETVPAKLLRLVSMTVELSGTPASTVEIDGLDLIANPGSGTVTATVTLCDVEPLVPLSVSRYCPGRVPLMFRIETAELPDDRFTVAGLTAKVIPVFAELLAVSDTVPPKLATLVTVTLDAVDEPTNKVSRSGFAASLKSNTVTFIVIWRDASPAVPSTRIV